MISRKVVVNNKSGLHLRPASIFAKIAADCKSEVTLVKGEKRVNPKSTLYLMSAAVKCGEEIELICQGASEAEDLQALIDAINSGLGEAEAEQEQPG